MRCLVNNTLVTRYIGTTPLTPVTTQCGLVSGSWAAAVPAADDFYAEKAVDTGSAEYAKTAAGYTHLAFNDDFTDATTIDYANTGAAGYNWYLDRPWGASTLAASEVTIANSVMTLTQADSLYNWGISTYHYGTQHGRGFMHGYYEARMRFDPSYATAITHDIQWPAFWSESINTCINNPPTFAELDFFEAYHPLGQTYDGKFTGTVHDWTRSTPNNIDRGSYGNNIASTPDGTNFTQWHDYGCLWEPGKIRWYFDGQLMLTQAYSATAPPYPNPENHPTGTYSLIDNEPLGMTVILGSGDGWPLEVDLVRIWN